MNRNRSGFTLVELTVVVFIIGVLATIAIPQYQKTVETSKALNAVGVLHMIASANKLYYIDHPGEYVAGQVDNAHALVTGHYIVPREWRTADPYKTPYTYTTFNPGVAGGVIASCTRFDGTYGGQWGYTYSDTMQCTPVGGAPNCPQF